MFKLSRINILGKLVGNTGRSFALQYLCIAMLMGLLYFGISTEGLAQATNTEADESENVPTIGGFRSARFGMVLSQTLNAIQKDFQIPRKNVAQEENNENRTTNLVVVVPEIFPDSDLAQINYIHGFKRNELIQVNILWGSQVNDQIDPQTLVTTANLLRSYFIQQDYDPQKVLVNTRLDDTVMIVFRAMDEQGHMVLLQLISKEVPNTQGEDLEATEPKFQVDALLLSYIQDVENPDIFQIEKGKF